MTAAIETIGLGKRYRSQWALRDCSMAIPPGRIAGLVGPNGAGKTTLLELAVGLLAPTTGTMRVLGSTRPALPPTLARVGFLAQDAPLYADFTVDDMLAAGSRLNPGWDDPFARSRLLELEIPLRQKCGKLSGGQRAQVGLALALGKRPELLLLDEPVASLDPLARREFLQSLMVAAAESGLTVVLSSHLVGELERVCDYLVVLSRSRVQVAGDVDQLLASHKLVRSMGASSLARPAGSVVVEERHTGRQSTMLLRTDTPVADPRWDVHDVGLEDLVLAYMGSPGASALPGPAPGDRIRVAVR